ncbi:hypothetical protein KI387_029184 [Taxus chinensis]|uniref:Protein kinase domain-containing protein n=1 Tax=Taxus chinensis TaxID=29808 RepID=A0AA38CHR6_TAXCH|nr:hypothetical protein KI387_029184 [Taxus chinensis]
MFLFFFFMAPAVTENPEEREALQNLRKILNVQNSDWPDGIRPCDWRGITCRGNRVIALNLSGLRTSNTSRAVPFALTRLTALQHLDLHNATLQGRIPPWLGSLRNLRSLRLSGNNLAGPIPPQLSRLTNITSLDLSHNNFTGNFPAAVLNLADLMALNLAANRFTGPLPRSIKNLARLQKLFLSFNAFSGSLPSELTELQNINTVDLAFNRLYGPLPENITLMKFLGELDVRGNFFNGSLPEKLIPISKTARNCFYELPNQHMERSCIIFYRRIGVHAHSILPSSPSIQPNRTNNNIVVITGVIEKKGEKTSKRMAAIVGGAVGGIVLILIIGIMVLCIQSHETISVSPNVDNASEGMEEIGLNNLGESFTYAQLQEATNMFDSESLIRVGHSGDFYRGVLQSGAEVAVKRIDLNRVKKNDYVRELEVFGKASHTRLVPLLGHCLEMKEEKFLVYKYMPNGDLESLLKKKMVQSSKNVLLHPLDWIARFKIVLGIAEGLVYLHHECSSPIMHRDIKASSILLDDKFEVRLGSLSSAGSPDGDSQPGLVARLLAISHNMFLTCGIAVACNYSSWDQGDSGSSMATISNDVCCFGKLLLEIISGMTNTIECNETHGESSWIDHALTLIDIQDKDALPRIVDPYLILDEDLLEEVWAVAVIAKACLDPRPSKRPSMRHVLKALENPRKVGRVDTLNDNVAARTSSYSSWNEVFGSCRSSNGSQRVIIPGTLREEYMFNSNSRGRSRRGHARPGSNDIVSEHTQEGSS